MPEAITVRCPSCETDFPVDPDKVPPGGVRARCSVCREIFPVDDPADAPPAEEVGVEAEAGWDEPSWDEPAEETEPEPEAGGFDLDGPDEQGDVAVEEPPADEAPEVDEAAPEMDEMPGLDAPLEVDEEPAAEEADADEADEEEDGPRPSFGQRSPEEKAERLARVLVSDMISYNEELYQEARERGTLKEDFEEEIEKSWEEYVEQVGQEMAESTSYWTDALNEILADGQDVF